MNVAVGVSLSLRDVEQFKYLPGDLGRDGCLIFMLCRSQVMRPLFLLASRRLKLRSESDPLFERGFFLRRSVVDFALCALSSNEVD